MFKLWEEGKAPEFVAEITSPSTHLEDLGRKRAVYEQLGVQEYVLFDPEGDKFDPPFRVYRARAGHLEPIIPLQTSGGTFVFPSAVLGLELHAHRESLRLVHPVTYEPLPVPGELAGRLLAAERAAAIEQDRADAEKDRTDALAAELARLRRQRDEGPF